jgi:hypothetical protein
LNRSYDIDGVLTVGIKPIKPCIIVSGRLSKYSKETEIQMKDLCIDPDIKIYLRPEGDACDRVSAGKFKAKIIKENNIDLHYEDDPVQINEIVKECPNIKIVYIKNERI